MNQPIKTIKYKRKRDSEDTIGLGLAIMSAMNPEGIPQTASAIAEVCECSVKYIQQIERDALRKLARRLAKLKPELFR